VFNRYIFSVGLPTVVGYRIHHLKISPETRNVKDMGIIEHIECAAANSSGYVGPAPYLERRYEDTSI